MKAFEQRQALGTGQEEWSQVDEQAGSSQTGVRSPLLNRVSVHGSHLAVNRQHQPVNVRCDIGCELRQTVHDLILP
jgi:hypothetical protein